eukprot:254067_1
MATPNSNDNNNDDPEITNLKDFIKKYKLHKLEDVMLDEGLTMHFLLQETVNLQLIAQDLTSKYTQQQKFIYAVNEFKKQNKNYKQEQFPNNNESKNDEGVITDGLIAWFDVNFSLERTKWKSKVNGYELSPCCVKRQNNRTPYNQKAITLRKSPNLNINGVYFDYEHTMKFNKTINCIQTIISIHSYETETGSKHEDVHGKSGDLGSFYILTSSTTYPFHGGWGNNYNLLHVDHAQSATIRLDGDEKELNACDVVRWEGGHHRMAILTLNNKTNNLQIDRIGADRIYHHFCGTIIELFIYDRKLTSNEKVSMENYLQKYFK